MHVVHPRRIPRQMAERGTLEEIQMGFDEGVYPLKEH